MHEKEREREAGGRQFVSLVKRNWKEGAGGVGDGRTEGGES